MVFLDDDVRPVVTRDGRRILVKRILVTSADGCTAVVETASGKVMAVRLC